MGTWKLPPIRFFVCLKCETIHRMDDVEGQLAMLNCEVCDGLRIMYRVDYEQAKKIDPRVATSIAIHDFNNALRETFGPVAEVFNKVLMKITK